MELKKIDFEKEIEALKPDEEERRPFEPMSDEEKDELANKEYLEFIKVHYPHLAPYIRLEPKMSEDEYWGSLIKEREERLKQINSGYSGLSSASSSSGSLKLDSKETDEFFPEFPELHKSDETESFQISAQEIHQLKLKEISAETYDHLFPSLPPNGRRRTGKSGKKKKGSQDQEKDTAA
jgi:hypothetical protein